MALFQAQYALRFDAKGRISAVPPAAIKASHSASPWLAGA